jgi:GxxExxY protein
MLTKKRISELEYQITGACIEVDKYLGPGLLESVYHKCLMKELEERNLRFSSEQLVAVSYKDILVDTELRLDLYVEHCIAVELKAVKEWEPVFDAQLLTYMKLLDTPKGLLFNFNCVNIIQHGKKSFVNEFYQLLPDEGFFLTTLDTLGNLRCSNVSQVVYLLLFYTNK